MSLVETIEKNVADTYGKGEESPHIESNIQRQSIMMMERQESVINHNRELFKEEDVNVGLQRFQYSTVDIEASDGSLTVKPTCGALMGDPYAVQSFGRGFQGSDG